MQRTVRVRFKSGLIATQTNTIVSSHSLAKSRLTAPAIPELKAPGSFVKAIIPPASVRGWLTHGFAAMMLALGLTPCSTVSPENMDTRQPSTKELYTKEVERGYHHRGICCKDNQNGKKKYKIPYPDMKVEQTERGCLYYEAWGGFQRPSVIRTRLMITQPNKSKRNYIEGIGQGYYRLINQQTTSPETRGSYFTVTTEEIGHVDTILNIDIFGPEDRIPVLYGAIIQTIEYLHANRHNPLHQYGGKKSQGAGVIECEVLNPLYDEALLKTICGQEDIDEIEQAEFPASEKKQYLNGEAQDMEEVKSKRAGKRAKLDAEWLPIKEEYIKAFMDEVAAQMKLWALEDYLKSLK